MSQDTVYISATETGLVKWDEFRKPPYSEQDYLDAYNNGQRMTQAFNDANANGASKVVLERGNYPLCYVSDEKYIANLTHNNVITGTTNLTIDGNGSCTFTIFDSVNRSPYHTGDGAANLEPYQLSGAQFRLEHNTNLTIKGFNLRGDQYNRTWVTGEHNIEQTYGIVFGINNINTTIDVTAHGFRGDALSGKDTRLSLHNLTGGDNQDTSWLKGGLSTTDGTEIEETGAYRTRVLDMRDKTIYRNAVQLMTIGNAATMSTREDALQAFFYDENNVLISTELVWQAEYIYLPVNCAFMRIVAYGDERTDDTVGYGRYLFLVTGVSNHALVKGEYFANMRGAVSNLCNNTIIDADIHDNGTLKYGFPHFGDTTRYGVNFEDSYYSKLTVKGSIRNGGSAILCNARRLDVDCDIKNMLYTAIVAVGTKEVNVKGGVIDNARYVLTLANDVSFPLKRFIHLKNVTIRNSLLLGDYSNSEGLTLDIDNNIFDSCSVNLKGNGNNLNFNRNTIKTVKQTGPIPFAVTGAAQTLDNFLDVSTDSYYVLNRVISLSATSSARNTVIKNQSTDSSIGITKSGEINTVNGTEYQVLSGGISLLYLRKSEGAVDEVFKAKVKDCTFINGYLTLGNSSNSDLCSSDVTIENTVFYQNDVEKTHSIHITIRDAITTGVHKIVFKNCEFNLPSSTTSLLRIGFPLLGKLDITFIDCTFIKDTPTTERFKVFYGVIRPNVTARAQGCRFINVNP